MEQESCFYGGDSSRETSATTPRRGRFHLQTRRQHNSRYQIPTFDVDPPAFLKIYTPRCALARLERTESILFWRGRDRVVPVVPFPFFRVLDQGFPRKI